MASPWKPFVAISKEEPSRPRRLASGNWLLVHDRRAWNDFNTLEQVSDGEQHVYSELQQQLAPFENVSKIFSFERNNSLINDSMSTPQKDPLNAILKLDIRDLRTGTFLNLVRNEVFESGYSTNAESMFLDLLAEDPTGTKEWINAIYLKYFADSTVLLGILHIFSHIAYDDVSPVGPTIALASLNHQSVEVRETAVMAFENWGHPESLSILRSIKCNETWLQDYVNQVIEDFEEELNGQCLS